MEIMKAMMACIAKCGGDKEKAMCTPEGCDLMAEWNLLCFDKNGDNVLDKDEFSCCMKAVSKKMCNKDLTDDECSAKFKECDADGDGAICLSEFLTFCRMSMAKKKMMSGNCTPEEFCAMCKENGKFHG